MRKILIFAGVLAGLALLGLGLWRTTQQLSSDKADAKFVAVDSQDISLLFLDLDNLPPLNPNMYFLIWIQDENGHWNQGPSFTSSVQGALLNQDNVPTEIFLTPFDSTKIQGLRITVEHNQYDALNSNERIILEGEVEDGSFVLHSPAKDLEVEGTYALSTPTNGNAKDSQEQAGIWFAHFEQEGFDGPSLSLPKPPTGFEYDATISIFGFNFHTIGFETERTNKHNLAFSGEEDPYPVPGLDLLVNAPSPLVFPLDISLGLVEVSLNLRPIDIEGKFFTDQPFIPLLQNTVPEGAPIQSNLPLTFGIHFPQGSGRFE